MRILTRPNVGGPTLQAASLWREHRRLGAPTLLVVGRCRADEPGFDLRELGVPPVDANAVDPAVAGYVELPDLGTSWSPLAHGRAARQLRQLLRAFAPQVVHTHTSRAGWLGRRLARAAAVPVVAHTFHGHVLRDYFGRVPSWLLARLEAHLARSTDLLFAVSSSCAEELAGLGVAARDRMLVVPPAVPLPAFASRQDARARLGLAADAWVAACVGRLVPVKRVDRFVAAMAALPGVRGDIHGDGPLRSRLAASLPADGRVRLLGASPAARELLTAYDALVIPSAREGCPLVAVEAFAAGVPVVAFDVPGCNDALGRWGGGLLVPADAGVAGLTQALRRLRTDAGLRQDAIARGRAAGPLFSPPAVARCLLEAYDAALRRRIGYAAPASD